MVQQVSVQQISLPKAEPKEKTQPEQSSFKNALKQAESSLPSKDENKKANSQTVGEEKESVPEEEKLPEASQQNNSVVSPLMLWFLMGNSSSEEQNTAASADLLTTAVQQMSSASSETALTALTAIGSTTEKTGVTLQQLLLQQMIPQTLASESAAQTANLPVAQQTQQTQPGQTQTLPLLTPLQEEIPAQPIVQETALPQLVVQTADLLPASSKTEQKGNQAVQKIPALSSDPPSTATAALVPAQTQQNNLGSALSGHTQDKPADTTGNTSEQNSDFAAMFISQNDSVSASSTEHTSVSSKLSAGTAAHLTEQILKNVQAKNNSFRMELFPQDLGKISVSLKMEQGLLVVDILADSPRTQSLLASGSGEIRSLLESAVGQPVQVTQPPQDAPAYYQQEQESSSQKQEQQPSGQQHQEQETTEDFLSVLQQMKEQSSIL